MDQKTIMEGLVKALNNGSGTLDDLDNLLNRAKEDIAKAKKEEAEAKEKAENERGMFVASMATRILNDKTTDEDCAYVINSWMRANGLGGKGLSGEDLREIFTTSEAASKKVSHDLDRAIEELAKTVKEWAEALGLNIEEIKVDETAAPKKKQEKKDKSPDDVIDEFLKSFGLR